MSSSLYCFFFFCNVTWAVTNVSGPLRASGGERPRAHAYTNARTRPWKLDSGLIMHRVKLNSPLADKSGRAPRRATARMINIRDGACVVAWRLTEKISTVDTLRSHAELWWSGKIVSMLNRKQCVIPTLAGGGRCGWMIGSLRPSWQHCPEKESNLVSKWAGFINSIKHM